jgi:Anti-sigma-K factor rskA, C-terminal
MTCEDLRDSYELYSLGLLEGEEKRAVEEHLGRNCAVCQKHFKDALGVNALMLSQAQEIVPPSRLRRRVLASVGRERAGWGWAAALAAACSLIVTLWLSLEKRTTDRELATARVTLQQTVAERDRLDQAFTFLNQPETRLVNFGQDQPASPRGNFFLNPRMGILLIASNLPALPDGKAYEMWVIPKGGTPRPAGLFQSGPQGTAIHAHPGTVDPTVTLAVTVEPDSGSASPASDILFTARF